MGYRGKLATEHTSIDVPPNFVEKYKTWYYIGESEQGPKLNISSLAERKGHHDILEDLKELLKSHKYEVFATILWEDGRVDRIELKSGKVEYFHPVF